MRKVWVAILGGIILLCIRAALAATIDTAQSPASIEGGQGKEIPPPIFQLPACPVVTPELQRQVLAATSGAERCKIKCTGCGCKGGPGYRGPGNPPGTRGQCVGYKNILTICGPPPHALCSRECAKTETVCKSVQTVRKSKKRTKPTVELSSGPSSAITQSQQGGVQTTPRLTTPP